MTALVAPNLVVPDHDQRRNVADRRVCIQVPRVEGRRVYDRRGLPVGADGDALYGRRASDPR